MQFSGIKHVYIFAQLSQVSISRTFSSCQTEVSYLQNKTWPFPPSPEPSLVTSILLSVSVNLTTLGVSSKWNHTIICPFVSSLFCCCNIVRIYLCCSVSEFFSFLRLDSIPLCGYTMFCLIFHLPMGLGLVPHFGYYELHCCEHGYTHI